MCARLVCKSHIYILSSRVESRVAERSSPSRVSSRRSRGQVKSQVKSIYKGPSIKYVTLGRLVGCRPQRYEALHGGGGGGYLADRYVTLILNFICLVFSLSIERLVQLRRVNKTVLYTLLGILYA